MTERSKTRQYERMNEVLATGDASQGVALAGLDPEYFDAAERILAYPDERGALSGRDRALLDIAFDALVTQLDVQSLRRRIERAAELGVTRDEVTCVLEIVAVIGMHSVSVGVPVLAEELETANASPPVTPRHTEIASRFETSGLRPRPLEPMYEAILRLDPDYFERFVAFIDVPWREDVLDPRIKHLVCIAIDVACTHLYVEGIRRHVREALALGVTAAEIFEVVQLASATGLRTLRAGLPIVTAVFDDANAAPSR
jgi:alkylhydroperoxidase/carboxymuconolactone decarboxylase family protein YurZ